MSLKSSNIANILLQSLNKLTQQENTLLINKETAKIIQTLETVCTVLIDSADTVAEGTGNPEQRDNIFGYAKKLKLEAKALEDIRLQIETDTITSEQELRSRLISSAKAIILVTNDLVSVSNNEGDQEASLQKVISASKECATSAKNLVRSLQQTKEEFFAACKTFGAASLQLAAVLQETAGTARDSNHQNKVISASTNIREISPQLIRAAKRAFDNPESEGADEVHQLARQLASKLSYAISVSQPDGGQVGNELSYSQPTIPLPPVAAMQEIAGEGAPEARRKRTIQHPAQGQEILRRARVATQSKIIVETLEEAAVPTSSSAKPVLNRWPPAASSTTPASTPLVKTQVAPAKPMGLQVQPKAAVVPAAVSWKAAPSPQATSTSATTPAVGFNELKQEERAEEDEAESYIEEVEKDMANIGVSSGSNAGNDEWKWKYLELEKEVKELRSENQRLREELGQFFKIVDGARARSFHP